MSWWYTGCLEEVYSFLVEMDDAWREDLVRDPMADALDSVLRGVGGVGIHEEGRGVGSSRGVRPGRGLYPGPQLLTAHS
jgi:hypothetical protein